MLFVGVMFDQLSRSFLFGAHLFAQFSNSFWSTLFEPTEPKWVILEDSLSRGPVDNGSEDEEWAPHEVLWWFVPSTVTATGVALSRAVFFSSRRFLFS